MKFRCCRWDRQRETWRIQNRNRRSRFRNRSFLKIQIWRSCKKCIFKPENGERGDIGEKTSGNSLVLINARGGSESNLRLLGIFCGTDESTRDGGRFLSSLGTSCGNSPNGQTIIGVLLSDGESLLIEWRRLTLLRRWYMRRNTKNSTLDCQF